MVLIKRVGLLAVVALVVGGGIWLTFGRSEDDAPVGKQLPPAKTYPQVSDLAADTEITAPRFASLSYGVHTALWWDATYREWDLENVRQLNFAYVKQPVAWRDIQPARDEWVWNLADEVVGEVEYRQRRMVARIDTAPEWAVLTAERRDDPVFDLDALAQFCGALAERYRGRIEAYQIWNEPNLDREWAFQMPSPTAYVDLLAACGGAIRAADPNAIIISAGISPTGTRNEHALPDEEFFWEMYAAGASQHFDVLGVHAPGYSLPPEASIEDTVETGVPTWARFRHVETVRAIMVANGDAHKQIAITEMGWTTDNRPDSGYSWFGVSQETQADYLRRAYGYAAQNWRPWVGLMSVLYLSKPAWTPDDEQWWWSLDEPADPPIFKILRPAYGALANMEKISDNPDFSEPERDPNEGYILEPLPPRD